MAYEQAEPNEVGTVKSKMTAIADAIRDKTGSTAALTLDGMAAAIAGLDATPVLEELTITANGEYAPGDGVAGFSRVVANVASAGGSGFTPQAGSFVPTEAQGGVNIALNENIPDNFAVILLLHDKNVESFINAGAVMLTAIHYNGEFIRACFASSTSALIAANRSSMMYGDGNTGSMAYDSGTRVLYLTVATASNFYLQQYDYCIVPCDGLNLEGWFA